MTLREFGNINMATATTENMSNQTNIRYCSYISFLYGLRYRFKVEINSFFRDGGDGWKTKLNLPAKDRRVKTTVSKYQSTERDSRRI